MKFAKKVEAMMQRRGSGWTDFEKRVEQLKKEIEEELKAKTLSDKTKLKLKKFLRSLNMAA